MSTFYVNVACYVVAGAEFGRRADSAMVLSKMGPLQSLLLAIDLPAKQFFVRMKPQSREGR